MALKALMEWLFLRKGGLMWLQCVPGESFCRSRPCELYSCPYNTFICIWKINWVAFAMALIVGLTCRDMRPSSIDDTHPPIPQVSLHLSLKHIHAQTRCLSKYSPVVQCTYVLSKKKRGKDCRASVGEGEQWRHRIPCMHNSGHVWSRTKKGWRVGQRESRMEMQGRIRGNTSLIDAGGCNGWQKGWGCKTKATDGVCCVGQRLNRN